MTTIITISRKTAIITITIMTIITIITILLTVMTAMRQWNCLPGRRMLTILSTSTGPAMPFSKPVRLWISAWKLA